MEIYVVGGAVRDVILGLTPKDIDFCVVGSTPEEMIDLGYKAIAASSFPVFHDSMGQEFALARTEMKNGSGYHGFVVDYDTSITIESDLMRRDLTINSMAVHINNWESFKNTKCEVLLIDPYGGIESINKKEIKHTSKYFVDDPLRSLRAVRLSTRYGFDICDSTRNLIIKVGNDGGLDHLTSERIWLEISKVLSDSKHVSKFFKILEDVGISKHIFPEHSSDQSFLEGLFIDYNDLDLYDASDIIDDEYAFLSMINTNSIPYIEMLCKKLKIPNRFLRLIKSYNIIQQLFYDAYKDPKLVLDCLNDLSAYSNGYETFRKSLNFFIHIEKEYLTECQYLKACFIITCNTNFDQLSSIEKISLKGAEIKKRLYEIKIDKLEHFMI